ncbi:hypothetical protein KKH14_01420 [Patescibacteria group bacterium]|nr:hypothetical protein [Patescibacteria group bacterium]
MKRIEKWNRKITCSAKIILIIVAVIVYFNIGYLVTYSTVPETPKTPTTQMIWKILNFADGMDINKQDRGTFSYIIATVLWPLVVLFIWLANLVLMSFNIICFFLSSTWSAIHWTFTGGVWKLTGLIK